MVPSDPRCTWAWGPLPPGGAELQEKMCQGSSLGQRPRGPGLHSRHPSRAWAGVQPRLPSSHLPSSCGQEGWGWASPRHPSTPPTPPPLCERLTGIPGSARLGLGSWRLSCWRLGVCAGLSVHTADLGILHGSRVVGCFHLVLPVHSTLLPYCSG